MNHNHLAVLISFCLASVLVVLQPVRGSTVDLSAMQALEEKLAAKGWDASVVIEGAKGLSKHPEFASLILLMQRDWKSVASAIMSKEPSSMQKALLLALAHKLDPAQYRDFLSFVVTQAEQGHIEKRELNWAIFPPYPQLADVWSNSYQEPQTVSAVQKVKKLFADDPAMQSHCERLLSGELMRESGVAEKRMNNPGPNENGNPPTFNGTAGSVSEAPSKSSSSYDNKRETGPAPSNEPSSSTPWSIIVVLIVAGCGLLLLWLLVKRRS